MRKRTKKCQVCGQPSTGKLCRPCFSRSPMENKQLQKALATVRKLTREKENNQYAYGQTMHIYPHIT